MTEQYPDELDQKIAGLEEQALAALEQPDLLTNRIDYTFDVAEGLTMSLHSESCAYGEQWDGEDRDPGMTTGIFISQERPPEAKGCRTQVVFSCLYEQEPASEQHIHGMCSPQFAELPPRDQLQLSPGLKLRTYLATVALAGRIKRDHFQDSSSTWPHDSLNELEKEVLDDRRPGLWSFELPFDERLMSRLLRGVNVLLADGLYHRRAASYRELPDAKASPFEVSLESNSFQGQLHYANPWRVTWPALRVAVTEENVEHEYLRLQDGTAEIQLHHGDEIERYRQLESFKELCDEDGNEWGWKHSEEEYQEVLAAERALGMFKPTAEKLDFLLDRVRQLKV